jgi:hypothetical protein
VRSLLARLTGFLRAHPILCLFLLTPGLVEYLSGSSSFVFLVVSPGWFLLALGINAAMYTSGALLIREALIRWNKGWPTVFALRGAYAIMEEGISDQTIFNPHTSPIGAAGLYGRFAGVNWMWVPDVFLIHILIALDSAFLAVLVVKSTGNWYGCPLLAASIAAIVALCLVGRRLPREIFARRTVPPTASRLRFFVVGCVAYPLMVIVSLIGASQKLPPVVLMLLILGMTFGFFYWVLRNVGTERYERHVVAFGAGLVALGMVLGVLFEFPWEFVLIADVAVVYFFYWLDRDLAARGTDLTHPTPGTTLGITS